MSRGMLLLSALIACLSVTWTGSWGSTREESPCVVVRFKSGKASLDEADKAELRRMFQTYAIGPQSRIFVVGYTDALGGRAQNSRLARRRADAVRREIVGAFGIDAAVVAALGKGEDNPVADNKSAKGRSLNRRVEVYLVNARKRVPQRVFGPGDPYLTDIQNLIQEAEAMLRKGRLAETLQSLSKARALGGDHYSDWHAVYGVAGYFGNAPMEETRAHLVTALNLDQYNFKAREFLSRMEARLKVTRGQITRAMGQSADKAIKVSAMAQQYEYLRLFEAEPLAHRELGSRPIDMWRCKDKDGAQLVYYFDHSGVYDWAFALSPDATAAIPVAQNFKAGPAQASAGFKASTPAQTAAPLSGNKSKTVWESEIFK